LLAGTAQQLSQFEFEVVVHKTRTALLTGRSRIHKSGAVSCDNHTTELDEVFSEKESMMKRNRILLCVVLVLLCAANASASVFGDVRGIVYDPQQNPVKDARVTLHARTSDFSQTIQTNDTGLFLFRAISIGEYIVTIESNGFSKIEQPVTVISDSAPVLHFQLAIAPLSQSVDVVATPELVGSDSPTPTTLISRRQIERTPGADRTNSLAMITDYVPGSYMTHTQLHIRGGHQVTWLIDGVPVANTNIASNVGPQFDPKDIDYLEVQRGSYSAEYGDRTYGVFNVVPRTGFERNNEAELEISYGNFHQTNDQLNFGSHTKRFAYYASVNGNRSDYGLAPPTSAVLHDQSNGFGGFTSLIYNPATRDQFRLVTALRRDFYQAPNDSEAQDAGIRDVEREGDAFVNFSWVRTIKSGVLLTVSPFYHFNRADYVGGASDAPVSPRDKHDSQYAGAQVTLSALKGRHNVKGGFYGFFQHDSIFFGLQGMSDDGSPVSLQQRQRLSGNLEAVFAEDQYKLTSWLTLTGGVRLTRFHGAIDENAMSPRAGASVRIPRLRWVLHGFYGRYYQAPPLSTVSGPLLELALNQGFGFLPLHGERDEEYQFGLTVPVKGWTVDTDYFHTGVKNFFDHNALGNSNIFFPLTIERARIRAFELSLRSPILRRRGQVYLAYSRQKAEGQGVVTGGLTDFSPPAGFFLLDHDQRHTMSAGFNLLLPSRGYVAGNLRYGSGFTDAEGPGHLPGRTLVDLSVGRAFGEDWAVSVQALNVANRRFLLDNSNTFGGTHFVDPREVYVELRYLFHY
jgi:outer membrane receptor protein involved in Fe transport